MIPYTDSVILSMIIFTFYSNMRDLLNLVDNVIDESKGLVNRKPGEIFANEQGHEIMFDGIFFYPESGKYQDQDQVKAAFDAALDQLGINDNDVIWFNNRGNMLAFGLALFHDSNNRPHCYGKWIQSVHANKSQNKQFSNALPDGYKLQSKSAKKEATNYKPTDVLTQLESNTPESIYNQIVAKFGSNSYEAQATEIFIRSNSFPVKVPKGNMNFVAFRDYFCEMLQPIALVTGKKLQGDANEAADLLFGQGSGFGDCVISFSSGKNTGLYDSLLTAGNGQSIKLSSKGEAGARASVNNLYAAISELSKSKEGQKFLEDHHEVMEILTTIAENSAIIGPLKLAVEYDIITSEEAQQILNTKGMSEVLGKNIISPRLEQMYQDRVTKNSTVIPIYHLVAIVAHQVAKTINENTNFSHAASEILNHGALIQVYTYAKEDQEHITITNMKCVYPSKMASEIYLDANKTYYSTDNKGKFTFNIKEPKSEVKESDFGRIYGRKRLD